MKNLLPDLVSSKEGRVVIDLFNQNGGLFFRLGRAKFLRAGMPLAVHNHCGMFEIVLVIKGSQNYTINGTEYRLESGDGLLTFPDEPHSSGDYPEDKAFLYYLIVDLESPELALGNGVGELGEICKTLYQADHRIFSVTPKMKELCDLMIENYYGESAFKQTIYRNLISSFILNIIEGLGTERFPIKPTDLQPVLDYIDAHIEADISIEQLAKISKLSVSRFKGLFRSQVGFPPKEYLLRKKIDQAERLLTKTSKSITEISFDLSFSSSQYFSTVFKRFRSISPSAFRHQK